MLLQAMMGSSGRGRASINVSLASLTSIPDDAISLALDSRGSVPDLSQLKSTLFEYENKIYSPSENIYAAIKSGLLDGFNSSVWMAISKSKHKTKIDQSSVNTTLLSMAMEKLSGQSSVNVFVIGDFEPVSHLVTNIDEFLDYVSSKVINWSAQVPDPYAIKDVNSKFLKSSDVKLKMSSIHSLYDKYMGDKWMCGADGTGSMSNVNINSSMIQDRNPTRLVVMGVLSRDNYLSDVVWPSMFVNNIEIVIELYTRLCLSVIANSVPGGIGIIKVSMPKNRALKGIYVLCSIFFQEVRLLKFNNQPPDDDTCYLMGIGFRPRESISSKLTSILDPEKLLPVISKLADLYSIDIEEQIKKVSDSKDEAWVNSLVSDWPLRNPN